MAIGANNRGAVQDETLSETKKDELREKIAREEALLAEIDRQREAARARLRALRSQLAALAESSRGERPSSDTRQTAAIGSEPCGSCS